MDVRRSDAKAPVLLGVFVLLEYPLDGRVETRSYVGPLELDQGRKIASELREIAGNYENIGGGRCPPLASR